jgi:catechol 2,3-dioxygenase-like lactoylglutathione lyase family enzyme
MDTKLEVVVLPVSDVDRAKQFYGALGWREDGDFVVDENLRVVQMTPPGSPTSVIFGKGITNSAPGSVQDLILAVEDIEKARAELAGRGADVTEVYHDAGGIFYHAGTGSRLPGPDPKRGTYASFASFSDPDGNGWVLQEVTTRLPGRLWSDFGTDVAALAELLHEAEEGHAEVEANTAKHNWWDWYAPYIAARRTGRTPEEAHRDATVALEASLR